MAQAKINKVIKGLKKASKTHAKQAYANLAASKYCKDPNYAKKSKGGKRKGKRFGGPIRGQGRVMSDRLR